MTDNEISIWKVKVGISDATMDKITNIPSAIPPAIVSLSQLDLSFLDLLDKRKIRKFRRDARIKSLNHNDTMTELDHFWMEEGSTDEGLQKNYRRLEVFKKSAKHSEITNEPKLLEYAKKAEDVAKKDPDFFTHLWEESGKYSREEMQEIWARMLSKKIEEPDSISIACIDTIKHMSPDLMKDFAYIVQFAAINDRAVFTYTKDAMSCPFFNDSKDFGSDNKILYTNILDLQSLGLIVDSKAKVFPAQKDAVIIFKNHKGFLLEPEEELNIECIFLTSIGKELSAIIDITIDKYEIFKYLKWHEFHLEKRGIKFKRLKETDEKGKFEIIDSEFEPE